MHGCQGGVWLRGGVHAWLGVCLVVGDVHGCRGHVWLQGAYMVVGGHAWLPGEHAWLWGACVVARGCIGYDEIWSMNGWYASYWNAFLLLPATKLGQSNIFTPVCHSVHRGGIRGCSWGGVHGASGGMHDCLGGHAWLLWGGVWFLWGGIHGCSGGCAWLLPGECMVAPGGMCVVAPGGHAWLFPGGMHGCSRGTCVVAPGGACVGYDEIWRYGQ